MNEETISPQSTQIEPSRSNSKIIQIGVSLLIVLVVALLIYKWPAAENVAPPLMDNQQDVTRDSTSGDLGIYYYTVDYPSQQNVQFKIFKVSPSLEKSDIHSYSFGVAPYYPAIITDSWKKNTILLVSNSETQATVSSVDVSSQNSQQKTVLAIPLDASKGERVQDAQFIDGGAAIAFIIADGKESRAENSVLNIVALQDQSKKESYQLSEESLLYTGFGFLAVTPDSKKIYLHETGGDGGSIWSQWYVVDRTTKEVQKLEGLPPIAKGERNPTVFSFSPDRSKLAYIDFSAVVEVADLDFEEYNKSDPDRDVKPCLKYWDSNAMEKYQSEGGTIMIRDLRTGNASEVFRNLSFSDNLCKNIARRIISLKWLDSSRVVFETIDGIYSLDVNTKQQQTLFTFSGRIDPRQQTRPSILSVQLPLVVFSDLSIINVDTDKRLEFIAPEAQEGYAFVLE